MEVQLRQLPACGQLQVVQEGLTALKDLSRSPALLTLQQQADPHLALPVKARLLTNAQEPKR